MYCHHVNYRLEGCMLFIYFKFTYLHAVHKCIFIFNAHAHSPKDGSEMLAKNSGTIFVFFSRLSE